MNKYFHALTMGLCLLVATFAQAQKEVYHLPYGKNPQQYIDLFLPKGVSAKTPVMIMIHGGAWTLGDNKYTDKHARDVRDRGFVVANVDYRYVNDSVHGTDLLADIDNAIAFVAKSGKTYGYKATQFHLMGISAGAHLSLLYGYTSKRKIKSITAMCAPSIFDETTFLAPLYKQGRIKIMEDLANARYNPAPGADISAFKKVSPYFHIKNIPTQLIHGDADELVDVNLSRRFYAKLQEMKVPANLIIHPGKGHDAGMNSPDTEKANIDAIAGWAKKWE
jgi:acetyl esterase/lipase